MASIVDDFSWLVGSDLDTNTNGERLWPAVTSAQASLQNGGAGNVRLRPGGGARNRHPTALDSIDHEASCVFTAFGLADDEFGGPAVRMNDSTATYYNVSCDGTMIGVEKYVEGTYDDTFAESFNNYVPVTVTEGDRVKLRVSGTNPVVLQVYINDVLVTALGTDGIVSDSEPDRIQSGNYVGLFGFSATSNQTMRMDDFAAADLSSGSGEEITGSGAVTAPVVTVSGSGAVGVPLTTATVNGTLIDKNGDPVEASGITVEMWEDVTNPVGAPDQTLTNQSSDSSGNFSWEFAIGGLTGTEDVFVRYIIPADPPTQFGAGVFTPTYG